MATQMTLKYVKKTQYYIVGSINHADIYIHIYIHIYNFCLNNFCVQAFVNTWNEACYNSKGQAIFRIPAWKTFLLGNIVFQGPCNYYIRVEVYVYTYKGHQLMQM